MTTTKNRLQLTHCEVQLISFAQCSQPVQAAALVVILEELNKACTANKERLQLSQGCKILNRLMKSEGCNSVLQRENSAIYNRDLFYIFSNKHKNLIWGTGISLAGDSLPRTKQISVCINI